MIDFHSHIIPQVDDGSRSFEMSLNMLKMAQSEGTKYICATSHYIPGDGTVNNFEQQSEQSEQSGTVNNFCHFPGESEQSAESAESGTVNIFEQKNKIPETTSIYHQKLKDLINLCTIEEIDINVMPGLELYMSPELPKLYKEKKIWGLNNTPYLLIELPMQQFPLYTEDVLYELRLLGAMPVIAHPERNLRILKDVSLLENLVSQGTLGQVNAGSLTGLYGNDIKSFAEKLVQSSLVHMVGSDAHDERRRTTKMKEALEIIKHKNGELYHWILNNESSIIEGKTVELPDITRKNKKSFLFGLFKR